MDNKKRHFWLGLLKWDLILTIAGSVVLAVVIGLSLAAIGDSLHVFDFGTASFSDLKPGAIHVKGAVTLHPTSSNGLTFGWQNTAVQEFSDKTVSDKSKMDYNGSIAPTSNTFIIKGLESGLYRLRFTVGAANNSLSTRVQIGGQAATVTTSGGWRTLDLVHEVLVDTLEISFSSGDGVTSWGINALQIFSEIGEAPQPSFELSVTPGEQQVSVGGTVVFNIGLTPINNYASSVKLGISGLVAGMTAEFMPLKIESPPGSSTLTITTADTLAPTVYGVTIRAVGVNDPEAVIKTTAVNITITKVTGTEEDKEDDEKEDVAKELSEVTDAERVEESIKGFVSVDKYLEEVESERLVVDDDLDEINRVALEFAAFPVVDLPPIPLTGTESALQTLTALGIIDAVVSSAPPGQRAPDTPQNLWQRFIGAIFSPAGG